METMQGMTQTTTNLPGSFSDWLHATDGWIEANDDHAAYHLALLERALRVLDDPTSETPRECGELAQKIERYRYQHMNEHSRSLSPEDERLIDILDLTANKLADRQTRPVRSPRHAIIDSSLDTESIIDSCITLDSSVPLEQIAAKAAALTQANFPALASGRRKPTGNAQESTSRRMLLYAPLYVSNECINYCTYCGFRYPNKIAREFLAVDQVVAQAKILLSRGFRHLLIVGGDFPAKNTPEYYRQLIEALVELGVSSAIEIAAQTTESYELLASVGVCGLTLYQETYDPSRYREYHIRGPKASFHWRLEAHDRAAEAGIERFGLGLLLGLADPREDLLAMMRHAVYLTNRFPDRKLAFSLPRIHEAPNDFRAPFNISDETFIRLYCALRIAFPRAELVLSTREPAYLRNRLTNICITQMSAGSSTSPGGYDPDGKTSGEQFPVSDDRSPAEVSQWLTQAGFQVLSLPDLEWEHRS